MCSYLRALLPLPPKAPTLASSWADQKSFLNPKRSSRRFKSYQKVSSQQPISCLLPLFPNPISLSLLSSHNSHLEPPNPSSHTHTPLATPSAAQSNTNTDGRNPYALHHNRAARTWLLYLLWMSMQHALSVTLTTAQIEIPRWGSLIKSFLKEQISEGDQTDVPLGNPINSMISLDNANTQSCSFHSFMWLIHMRHASYIHTW